MIIRTPKRDRYTIISKVPLEDVRLSWKARGLLSYLLSKPDNWTVVVSHLVKEAPDGRDSVFAGLKELEQAGYIRRDKTRGTVGRFDGVSTEVFEEPTVSGLSVYGKAVSGKSDTNEEGLIKINESKERALDFSDEKPVSPDEYSEKFKTLWKLYPNKKNKIGAYKKYKATLKAHSDVTHEILLLAVENYRLAKQGVEESYLLHGSTFFGPDQRWRDWLTKEEDQSLLEFEMESAVIFDRWDADMCWVSPDTGEECFQNPTIHGYIRPRGPQNTFVASDGTLYEFDSSGRRVAVED